MLLLWSDGGGLAFLLQVLLDGGEGGCYESGLLHMTIAGICGIPGFVCLQVILMVGLPGSGKTQWALKYSKENPEKRYNVLGAETVLNQMRVSCFGRLVNWVIALGVSGYS